MDAARSNRRRRWRFRAVGAVIATALIAGGLALASAVQKVRIAARRSADL